LRDAHESISRGGHAVATRADDLEFYLVATGLAIRLPRRRIARLSWIELSR
jgi:hypothetical protein